MKETCDHSRVVLMRLPRIALKPQINKMGVATTAKKSPYNALHQPHFQSIFNKNKDNLVIYAG